jgi:ribonuclease HII
MLSPNFVFEKRLWKKGFKVVVGLDEVGRGAFAGPLVVGGCAYIKNFRYKKDDILKEKVIINDSKRLTELQRGRSSGWVKKNCLAWAASETSARRIDKVGVSKATHSGFRRVVKSIEVTLGCRVDYLLIDAFYIPYIRGLKMPIKNKRKEKKKGEIRDFNSRQLAVINGDARSFSIASASIIAKVYRDKLMVQLGKDSRYKKYDWINNKGYGTLRHRKTIKKYGITKFHRKSFLEKMV